MTNIDRTQGGIPSSEIQQQDSAQKVGAFEGRKAQVGKAQQASRGQQGLGGDQIQSKGLLERGIDRHSVNKEAAAQKLLAHMRERTMRLQSEFTPEGKKEKGVGAGYLAAREDQNKLMLKASERLRQANLGQDPVASKKNMERMDNLTESTFGKAYNALLPGKSPVIGNIEGQAEDAGRTYASSKYMDNLLGGAGEFVKDEQGGLLYVDYNPRLLEVKNMHEIVAASLLMSNPDFHIENVLLGTRPSEDGQSEEVVAKHIDSGRVFLSPIVNPENIREKLLSILTDLKYVEDVPRDPNDPSQGTQKEFRCAIDARGLRDALVSMMEQIRGPQEPDMQPGERFSRLFASGLGQALDTGINVEPSDYTFREMMRLQGEYEDRYPGLQDLERNADFAHAFNKLIHANTIKPEALETLKDAYPRTDPKLLQMADDAATFARGIQAASQNGKQATIDFMANHYREHTLQVMECLDAFVQELDAIVDAGFGEAYESGAWLSVDLKQANAIASTLEFFEGLSLQEAIDKVEAHVSTLSIDPKNASHVALMEGLGDEQIRALARDPHAAQEDKESVKQQLANAFQQAFFSDKPEDALPPTEHEQALDALKETMQLVQSTIDRRSEALNEEQAQLAEALVGVRDELAAAQASGDEMGLNILRNYKQALEEMEKEVFPNEPERLAALLSDQEQAFESLGAVVQKARSLLEAQWSAIQDSDAETKDFTPEQYEAFDAVTYLREALSQNPDADVATLEHYQAQLIELMDTVFPGWQAQEAPEPAPLAPAGSAGAAESFEETLSQMNSMQETLKAVEAALQEQAATLTAAQQEVADAVAQIKQDLADTPNISAHLLKTYELELLKMAAEAFPGEEAPQEAPANAVQETTYASLVQGIAHDRDALQNRLQALENEGRQLGVVLPVAQARDKTNQAISQLEALQAQIQKAGGLKGQERAEAMRELEEQRQKHFGAGDTALSVLDKKIDAKRPKG